ncbi:hypothetical protein D3C87_2100520 [compost metagenome]
MDRQRLALELAHVDRFLRIVDQAETALRCDQFENVTDMLRCLGDRKDKGRCTDRQFCDLPGKRL